MKKDCATAVLVVVVLAVIKASDTHELTPFLLNALEFFNYYALFLLFVFKAMFLLARIPSSVLVIPQTPLSLGKMITTLKMMLCLKSGLEN